MDNFSITYKGVKKEYPVGTTFEVIANEHKDDFKYEVAIAVFNGKMSELFKAPDKDGELAFLDISSGTGFRTFRRTAVLMFMKAAYDCLGDENIDKIK